MEMDSGLKENLTFEAAPGTKFFYNTPAYAVLKKVLEGASRQSLDQVTQAWLAGPAGMKDTSWRKRPGAFADVGNPTGLVTTPRDIARMGQLVLDGGKAADGTRVISRTQLDALFKRTSTNPAYARLWWLNGGAYSLGAGAAIARTEGQLIPAAPADLVAAQGAQDRKLYVVPSRRLVVVRTGQAAPDRDFNQQLWTRLMQASPKK
jgi:CubicO group peptidase (beta-lactamase class C family)